MNFMNSNKLKFMALLALSVFLMGCPSGPNAGGGSEETNAIAGLVVDSQGNPVSGAIVQVRSAQDVPVHVALARTVAGFALTDTTDSKGAWHLKPALTGSYAVVIQSPNGQVSIRYIDFIDSARVLDTLHAPVSLEANVQCRWNVSNGSSIAIPGTEWLALADMSGFVRLSELPVGSYPLQMVSVDPLRYKDVVWWVHMAQGQDPIITGPYESHMNISDMAHLDSQQALPFVNPDSLEFPLDPEYGVRAWWSFDYLRASGEISEFLDVRGRAGAGVVYESVLEPGVQGNALALSSSNAFGVIENDGGILDSLSEFTIEAWVYVRSLPDSSDFDANLVGKLGFGSQLGDDVFSLSISRKAGAAPAFSMTLAQDSMILLEGFQVQSPAQVTLNQWHFVVASWTGENVCIQVNAGTESCSPASRSQLGASRQVWIFGKEDANVLLDDVKVYSLALKPIDVRYRWLRRIP